MGSHNPACNRVYLRCLASWKVQAWIASSMASGVSWLMVSGVRARANSRYAQDKVTASRVRIEMIQATSTSNGELNPSSARANSVACGKGRMTSRMRAMATSIAKGYLSVIGKLGPPCFYRKVQMSYPGDSHSAYSLISRQLFFCVLHFERNRDFVPGSCTSHATPYELMQEA